MMSFGECGEEWKRIFNDYIKEDQGFRHLEPETGKAIAVLADIPKLLEYMNDCQNMGGEVDMCVAIDEMMADSRRQGAFL